MYPKERMSIKQTTEMYEWPSIKLDAKDIVQRSKDLFKEVVEKYEKVIDMSIEEYKEKYK